MATAVIASAFTGLLEGLEETSILEAAGGFATAAGIAGATVVGLGIGIKVIIDSINANKLAIAQAQQFVNKVNIGLVNAIKITQQPKYKFSLTQEQIDLTKIIYGNEIASIEKVITNYNTIIDTYITGVSELSKYISNGSILSTISVTANSLVVASINVLDNSIDNISNILFNLGVISSKDISILNDKNTPARYIDNTKTSVLDLNKLAQELLKIEALLPTFDALLNGYYLQTLGVIDNTLQSGTLAGKDILDTIPTGFIWPWEKDLFGTGLGSPTSDNIGGTPTGLGSANPDELGVDWQDLLDKMRKASAVSSIAASWLQAILKLLESSDTDDSNQCNVLKRKIQTAIVMFVLSFDDNAIIRGVLKRKFKCAKFPANKVKQIGQGDKRPPYINWIKADVSSRSEWIEQVSFKFTRLSLNTANKRGHIYFKLKSGREYDMGIVSRGTFSYIVVLMLGTGYGWWSAIPKNKRKLTNEETISYNMPNVSTSKRLKSIEEEFRTPNIIYI